MNILSLLKRSCTLSNVITLIRIAMIPILVKALKMNHWGTACALFAIAAVSDVADGYLARLFDQQTILGAILDPIADKLLLGSCYVVFFYYPNALFRIPNWFFMAIFAKEVILLLGAAYAFFTYSIPIKPTMLGKLTMVLQSVFVGWLLASAYMGYVWPLGLTLFAAAIICCALAALIQYIYIAVSFSY